MASVNQTRPHCVTQMGKTHSKPLAARHARGTAWARHAMCESALMIPNGWHKWRFWIQRIFAQFTRRELLVIHVVYINDVK